MSDRYLMLTLRLVSIAIMLLPGVYEISSYLLPFKLLAEICTAFICMTASVLINDWLFADNYKQRLLAVIKSFFNR